MRFTIEELESLGEPRLCVCEIVVEVGEAGTLEEQVDAEIALLLFANRRRVGAEQWPTVPSIEEVLFGSTMARRRTRKRSVQPVWIC